MRYLRKHLQQIRLLSTLLFVGVLGGLLAPLPSEAAPPTLTLKLDTGSTVSILNTTSSTCTSAEVTLGYTACYAINTTAIVAGANAPGGVNRSYRVLNAPGATARLRVADKVGQDKFSLIGVQFVPAVTNWGSPAANHSEQHVLTITMASTFDSAVNVANSGTYVWALRAGGEFRAGPSPTTAPTACAGLTPTGRCDTIGDKVVYPGKGTFSPTLANVNILRPTGANSQPLSFTVAGPAVPIVSFNGLTNTTLGQVNPTYPSFVCDQDGGAGGVVCKPTITQTMTVTLKGPDSFVLVNGGDMFGANCAAELSGKQEKQIDILEKLVKFLNWLEKQRPNPRLSAFIDKIEAFLATINSNPDPDCPGATLVNLDIAIAAANDQVAFMADGAVAAEPEPPAPETGTITITKNTTLEASDSFTFDISGPSSSTETISMGGQNSESIEVTVDAGTYSVSEDPQAGWNLDSANCNNGPTAEFEVPSGGNVSCTFNNSPVAASTGKIRIIKSTSGTGGGETFDTFTFTIADDAEILPTIHASIPMNGTNGGETDEITVPVGIWDVREQAPGAPWTLTLSECGGGPNLSNLNVVVQLNTTVTCHFHNVNNF